MAFLKLNREKLKHNYNFLDNLFKENDIEWGVVSKLVCGSEVYLKEIINLGTKEIHDSRANNLKKIKTLAPDVQTVYIKPPAKRSIKKIVKYADVSFDTEMKTIELISKEAEKQGKVHKIIIMIEMGDLREGVMGDELVEFYAKVFKLPHIEVTGIGTNLNCLHGVLPSEDKLVQLSLYKQLIEAKYNRKIPWITGGSSVTLTLLLENRLPAGVNHFRVGETLFFGNNLVTGEVIEGMKPGVIKLYTEIIELNEKPKVPTGSMAQNVAGVTTEVNEEDYGKTSYRAIIDVGLLDVDPEYLIPEDDTVELTGASSDMLVVDLDTNEKGYKVGDLISFKLKYMGALSLMNSEYIEKLVE